MMNIQVNFEKVDQAYQEIGNNSDAMIGAVYFNIIFNGKSIKSYSNIKQEAGGSYPDCAIEASKPYGFKGPFNHTQFQQEVENYFKSLIGPNGRCIRLVAGSKFTGNNNKFLVPKQIYLDVDDNFAAGW
jgi:hypothetical protein